jgi:hypothetical protein
VQQMQIIATNVTMIRVVGCRLSVVIR